MQSLNQNGKEKGSCLIPDHLLSAHLRGFVLAFIIFYLDCAHNFSISDTKTLTFN